MYQYSDILNQDLSQELKKYENISIPKTKNVQVNIVLSPCLNSRHAPEMGTSSRRYPVVMSTCLMSVRGVYTHLMEYGIVLYDWGGMGCFCDSAVIFFESSIYFWADHNERRGILTLLESHWGRFALLISIFTY